MEIFLFCWTSFLLSCLPAIALPKCFGPNQERLQNFGRIKQKFTTSSAVFDDIFKLTLNLFSCLSSSRPILVTILLCHCIGFKAFQPSRPNRNLGWKKMGMSGDDERGEAVLSLHMRGLLGHPAGVRPSNHSRSIGNRPGSIISLTSHRPSFPPCVGAAGIFQGEPSSARCQYLFFYWICK